MHRISKTAMAAAIAIAFGGSAFAQQDQGDDNRFGQDQNREFGQEQQGQFGQDQNRQSREQQDRQFGQDRDQVGQQSYESYQSSQHGREAEQQMSRLDQNRDQRIDQTEAQGDPQLIAAWAEIDVSQDGSLDATEYYLYAAQTRIAELEQGQSQQTQAGQQQGTSVDFDEADEDNDGLLSRSEYQAAVQDRQSGGFGQSDFGRRQGQQQDDDGSLN